MSDVLYLAWRYLAYHRFKTSVLVGSVTLIVFLPVGLNVMLSESADQLSARAQATPLLIGAKGSPLELVLQSLYFETAAPAPLRYAEVARVEQSGLAGAIPLDTRFRTRHSPIVATTLDYLEFRQLRLERGRPFGMLGECVLGSQAARLAGVHVGESVMSSSTNVFELAGTYPLKMKVVGVLSTSGTPDDRAVFVDIKTAWVIAGLAHGHQDLTEASAESGVLRRDDREIVANASVPQYNEITPENVASFHFHGDPAEFPVTAIVARPHDVKSGTMLQGRYLGERELVQVVRPADIMDELLQTILTVRQYVLLAMGLVTLATLATMALVFALSLQLRRRELQTIIKLGGSRWRIVALVGTEILGVLVVGGALALTLSLVTRELAATMTRWLIQLA